MRRFFVTESAIDDGAARLSGADARHLATVLRAQPGQRLVLVDDRRREHDAEIASVTKDAVELKVLGTRQAAEKQVQVVLWQAVAKGEKMDWIVQKCTELGVDEIVPVITARTIVHLDEAAADKRRARWQRIAVEAAKQAQRVSVPQVASVADWSDLLDDLESYDRVVVLWEESAGPLVKALGGFAGRSLAIVIGPEGGLEAAEVEQLAARGAVPASLGKLILRTETAGVAALTLINHILGRYQ